MKPLVLCVHQIGKVGSTTVAQALQRLLPGQEIYQTHFLSERGVLKCMDWWLSRAQSPRFRLADHVSRSIELRRHFTRSQNGTRWNLFTLVREPIGRNVSAFFQNLHKTWTHRLPAAERQTCLRILKGDADPVGAEERSALVAALIVLFKAEYGARLHDEWFDAEIRDLFGIDVFATPFPAEKGYDIYEKENVRLILVRLEDLRRVFVPAVTEWLAGTGLVPEGLDSIQLESERANDGSSKAYAELYRAFRSELKMDTMQLYKAFNSRLIQHFYTEAERAKFLEQWAPTEAAQPSLSGVGT